jgi:riboflavin biosynthesis pyrimidine reductase
MDNGKFTLPGGALERLFERAGLPELDLPEELANAYGGPFGIGRPTLIANFVASLDGVVAFDGAGESGHVISGNSAADHFVMGLLRACAEAVVVGAGTLRASPKHRWTAEKIFPPAASLYSDVRRTLGLSAEPAFIVVTASGELDPSSPALANATIATTSAGEARLRGTLPPTARVVRFDHVDPGTVSLASVLDFLRAEGMERILTEGGPALVGRFLAEDLVDELFLTISPRLFGRVARDVRRGLVEGVDLGGKPLELASVRRQGSHLFLRYAFAPSRRA